MITNNPRPIRVLRIVNRLNIGGPTNSVYNFVKKFNSKIKKISAKKILGKNYPLNPSMNIKKLNQILND